MNIRFDRGNCSSAAIGKDASVTGRVIFGHNEDDGESVSQLHLVPHMKHGEGETVYFPDTDLTIEQVPETLAYYWSEIRTEGGISFSDSFVNEAGVAIASDSCRPSKKDASEEGKTKLGYALRKVLGERATSAREGMLICAEFVEKYGYISSRTYFISDKNEVWVINIPEGFCIAARRLGDDEILYMPNHFTIRNIDFSDTEHKNYYWSDDLVPKAIRNGWYKPVKEGSFDDFDFADAYQGLDSKIENVDRAIMGWKALCDYDVDPENSRIFSLKADRKYGIDDIKRVLRTHGEGTSRDCSLGGKIDPHRDFAAGPNREIDNIVGVCNAVTVDSFVVDFAEKPEDIRALRAAPCGCFSPYIPFYPVSINALPEGCEWTDVTEQVKAHFDVDPDEMSFEVYGKKASGWYDFAMFSYMRRLDYQGTEERVHKAFAEIEAKWESEKESVPADIEGRTAYVIACFEEARSLVRKLMQDIFTERFRADDLKAADYYGLK